MEKEDKKFYIRLVGWGVVALVLIFMYSQISTNTKVEEKNSTDYSYEKGYYDGQKAALDGDIRLVLVADSTNTTKWVWANGPYTDVKKKLSYLP